MATKIPLERLAYSPGEFAELFGKSQTWGYRQIYKGNVKTITEFGRTLIPASEVETILKTAGIYNGLKLKKSQTKAEIQALAPLLKDAWQTFLAKRRPLGNERKMTAPSVPPKVKWPSATSERDAVLARLGGRRKSP